jgi:hypothetical protein
MHIKYEVQQVKEIQMRVRNICKTRFLDILCVSLHLFQLSLKSKSDEKLISKIIANFCNMFWFWEHISSLCNKQNIV